MEKKTYISPHTLTVPIEASTLMAGSYLPTVDKSKPWLDDEGNEWFVTGYIYEEGHDGDDNYIIEYMFAD